MVRTSLTMMRLISRSLWTNWKQQRLVLRRRPRCIQGRPVRPAQQEEEEPSTACSSSAVDPNAPGGVPLGSGPGQRPHPCFGPALEAAYTLGDRKLIECASDRYAGCPSQVHG